MVSRTHTHTHAHKHKYTKKRDCRGCYNNININLPKTWGGGGVELGDWSKNCTSRRESVGSVGADRGYLVVENKEAEREAQGVEDLHENCRESIRVICRV